MALRYKHTHKQPLPTKEEARRQKLEREKVAEVIPDPPTNDDTPPGAAADGITQPQQA